MILKEKPLYCKICGEWEKDWLFKIHLLTCPALHHGDIKLCDSKTSEQEWYFTIVVLSDNRTIRVGSNRAGYFIKIPADYPLLLMKFSKLYHEVKEAIRE